MVLAILKTAGIAHFEDPYRFPEAFCRGTVWARLGAGSRRIGSSRF